MAEKTEGVIIDVNVSSRDQFGSFYHGAFLVAPMKHKHCLESDKEYFAKPGDHGAAVVDKETGILLGLVLATYENYSPEYPNVTVFLRIDHTLHKLQQKCNISIASFRPLCNSLRSWNAD